MPAPNGVPRAEGSFDPDDLVRHGRFVKSLARELARDEDEADELAARTMAAAVERRPATGPGLRAWLRSVVGRLFLRERRDAERRSRREISSIEASGARGATVPATVDLVARIELEHEIAAAFARLDEPYKTTLFLRFFDDASPSQIAARTGVPVETVKTRLKRGLARLRGTLDEKHEQRRDGWRAVAIALVAKGGGVMVATTKTKLAIAATIALLLAGGATWRELATKRSGETSTNAGTPAVATVDAPTTSSSDGSPATPVAKRVAESLSERLLPFASGVVVDEAGAPIADVAVAASRLIEPEHGKFTHMPLDFPMADRDLLALSDASGRFEVRALVDDVVSLYFVKSGRATAEWSGFSADRAENQDRRIVLAPGVRIAGCVQDSEGRAIPRAFVSVNAASATSEKRVARHLATSPEYSAMVGWETQRITVDEDGFFELTSIPARPFWFWCFADGYDLVTLGDSGLSDPVGVTLTRHGVILDVADAETKEPLVDARAIVLFADTGEIADHVVPSREEPISQCFFQQSVPGRLVVWKETFDRLRGRRNGRAVEAILHVLAPGHRSADLRVSVNDDEPDHLQVALARGEDAPTLEGRVVGAEQARIALRFNPPQIQDSSAQNHPPLAISDTDADGRFHFSEVPAGGYTLYASAAGRTPRWLDVQVPAHDVTIALAPAARLEVHVVNRAGVAQGDVTVHVQSADDRRAWSKHTDAAGDATLEELPDGNLYVIAVPGLYYSSFSDVTHTVDRRSLVEADAVVLTPGERRQIERRVPERVPVVVRARHSDDSSVAGVEILLRGLVRGLDGVDAHSESGGLWFKTFVTDARGEVRLDAYPGTYQIDVRASGRTVMRELEVPADGGTVELLVPDEKGTATVRGRVTELGHPDVPVIGRPVYASTPTADGNYVSVHVATDSDGAFELTNVLVGTVHVHAAASSSPDGTHDDSSPFRQVTRTVQLVPGQEIELFLAVPRTEEPAGGTNAVAIDVTVVDETSGEPVTGANVQVNSLVAEDKYDLASFDTDRDGHAARRVPAMERYSLKITTTRMEHGRWCEPFERQAVEVTPVDGRVRAIVRLKRKS